MSCQCAETALLDSSSIQDENEKLKGELSELHFRLTAARDASEDTKRPLQDFHESEQALQHPQQKEESEVAVTVTIRSPIIAT